MNVKTTRRELRSGAPPHAIIIVISTLIMVTGLISGCTSVTFKRGASPTTMAADEGLCRENNAVDAEFRDCMQEKGWFVTGTSNDEDLFNAPVSSDAGGTTMPPSKVIESQDPGVERTTAQASALSAATIEAKRSQTLNPRPASPLPGEIPETAAIPTTAPALPVSDPTALFTVASWWKFGGTAARLDADMAGCAENLGADHAPGAAGNRVTHAMGVCLRERGWHAIGK